MAFLEVLLALTVERLWLSVTTWRRFTWFTRFVAWSETRAAPAHAIYPGGDGTEEVTTAPSANKNGQARVLLLTLAPAVGVGLLHHLLTESLLILTFIFDVAVLVYCLGPKDLDTQVRSFIHAYTHLGKEEAGPHLAGIVNIDIAQAPLSTPQMLQALIEAILIEANERWFAVIFWFVVLGPLGAVFYRLSSLLHHHVNGPRPDNLEIAASGVPDNFAEAAQRLHAILGWVPARITALSYAVMGSFVDAIDGWNQGLPRLVTGQPPISHSSGGNAEVVRNSGLGALRMHDILQGTGKKPLSISHVRNALALVWRTLIFGMGFMLAATLINWLV